MSPAAAHHVVRTIRLVGQKLWSDFVTIGPHSIAVSGHAPGLEVAVFAGALLPPESRKISYQARRIAVDL